MRRLVPSRRRSAHHRSRARRADASRRSISARSRASAGGARRLAGDGSRQVDERRAIGPRVTGTPNYQAGDRLGDEAVHRVGAGERHMERFAFGQGWRVERFSAHIIAPEPQPIIGYPRTYSPSTKGTITGDVVRVDIRTEADFAKYKGSCAARSSLPQAARAVRMLEDRIVLRMNEEDRAEAMTLPEPRPRPRPGGDAAAMPPQQFAQAGAAVLRRRRRRGGARARLATATCPPAAATCRGRRSVSTAARSSPAAAAAAIRRRRSRCRRRRSPSSTTTAWCASSRTACRCGSS